ncbi:hypothetical protein QA942_26280 [Streptomyces sp. B21-106]|uniref:hypothetical protein n=1 Tax=Streptomyces sp. B21-106 TaxID=3039418 RepID=UPI002FF1EE11
MPNTPNAVLITLDGHTIPITLPDTSDSRYTVMKAVICCHAVEAVDLGDRWTMWVDETGGMLGRRRRPPNVAASALADRHDVTGGIRGPALVAGSSGPLNIEDVAAIQAAVTELVNVQWVTPSWPTTATRPTPTDLGRHPAASQPDERTTVNPVDQIFIVMANRITELEASIPEHVAADRPVAADMALYGARELRNILDLTAGPRWPVWAAETAKALDETDTPATADETIPDIRVFHRADGWTVPYEPGTQTCTINHVPEDEGRQACTATAVWKVVEQRDFGLTIGFWCHDHLPAEHRHLATPPTV